MASGSDEFGEAASAEGVPSALAAARDAVDSLLRDRGHRRVSPELTAAALLAGAAASARLDGSTTAPERLAEGDADPVAVGALRLSTELLSLVPVVAQAPVQALARMHALAASALTDRSALGRPRDAPGLAQGLQGLSRRLLAPTSAPAIAVAALAHAEVLRLTPFAGANGVVARALERLLLVARGVDPMSVTVPESGHLADEAEYRAAFAAYVDGGTAGRRRWLLHAATAVTRGAEVSPLGS